MLPSDGGFPVVSTGFGFWTGGTVNDSKSLFGQAFQELQFYPDTVATRCHPDGNVTEHYVPNAYTICSPVWSIKKDKHGNFLEPAVFNGILGRQGHPMIMHGGDTVTVHYYMMGRNDGWHITVNDTTSGKSGTIVLNSPTDGPLQPSYRRQEIGKSLGWGAVHDTPRLVRVGDRTPLRAGEEPVPVLPARAVRLLVVRHQGVGRHHSGTDRLGDLRGRLAALPLGSRVRLRRKGRGQVLVPSLRRSLLHLPVVLGQHRRLMAFRRPLPRTPSPTTAAPGSTRRPHTAVGSSGRTPPTATTSSASSTWAARL